jgi:hypothetical protein
MTTSFSHRVTIIRCITVVNLRLSMRYWSSSTMATPTAACAPASFKVMDHVDVLGKDGNNSTFQCKYCCKSFSGTATRVLIHLTGIGSGVAKCTAIDPDVKAAATAYKLSNDSANAAKKRKRDEQEELLRERRASNSTAGTSSSTPAARGSVRKQARSCLKPSR